MKNTLTLYELNMLVRETIAAEFTHEYWVEAELSEVREVRGHCYMQLVEYAGDGEGGSWSEHTPIAQAAARCWKSSWMLIRPHFERVTGQRLHAGLKVLLSVYPQFHEAYGFSWIVSDIDPTYTMGDMARKRQAIVRQLKDEGVFNLNKELALPLFAQRIAVVSSEGAAGYGDFVRQLEDNEYGFRFYVELFPAVMQGEQVEESVIAALNLINERIDDFDCAVIIRGGGAVADMSGFDTLMLAENVANFPLPIITGIGHERDESILDMVSHTRVKTPTAAAAFLVSHLKEVSDRIQKAQEHILYRVKGRMETEQMRISRLADRLPSLFSVVRVRNEARLDRLYQRFLHRMLSRIEESRSRCTMLDVKCTQATERKLLAERHRLQLLAQRVEAANPERLLKRGYSITLSGGKAVRDAAQLRPGDEIITKVENGTFRSIVKE